MKALYKKLLDVQKKLESVSKSKTNPHFKSKYFDINVLLEVLKPILNEADLLVLQPLVMCEGKQAIATSFVDPETGESLTQTFTLPEGLDSQKLGGAITFFRRYALTSALLVIGEKDDDGNTASGKASAGEPVTSDSFNL